MKKIIICADDYAQNEPISNAILDLVQAGRLSSVSCMTLSDQWYIYGKKLLDVANNVDVGLHFDLTHFDPVHFSSADPISLSKLLFASCLNRIDLEKVQQRLSVQLDAFEVVMGRAPDYIDGHQHVHILPHVRFCILNSLKQRYGNNLPYLRQVNPNVFGNITPIKALVLRLLAIGFKSLATRRGFQLSKYFFGIYSFTPVDYPLLFKKWLIQAADCSLIMCHPGYYSTDLSDPIRAVRLSEFNYLSSEQFSKDLQQNNIQISRWKFTH